MVARGIGEEGQRQRLAHAGRAADHAAGMEKGNLAQAGGESLCCRGLAYGIADPAAEQSRDGIGQQAENAADELVGRRVGGLYGKLAGRRSDYTARPIP